MRAEDVADKRAEDVADKRADQDWIDLLRRSFGSKEAAVSLPFDAPLTLSLANRSLMACDGGCLLRSSSSSS
jgi:hypothetical protein